MHPTQTPSPRVSDVPPLPPYGARTDLYGGIHKALRLALTRTLTQAGSTDACDAEQLASTLHQVERLAVLCEAHLQHENDFIHPALERARRGGAARITAEHLHHVEAIADLRDLASLVAHSAPAARPAALQRLYDALALFVADNLQHMHVEQTAHNALLWQAYSDAELIALEQSLVASIPPALMAEYLHWFFPALNAPERAGMLAGMREAMPAHAFEDVFAIAERTLDAAALARLRRDLGRSPGG